MLVIAALLVFLFTSSPLRAEEWSRSMPAAFAHQLIGGSATQAVRCAPCPHPDPAYGSDPVVGFLAFGAERSGLYMYDATRDRYWLVNVLEVTESTSPVRLPYFGPAIDRAAGLAQYYQGEPSRIERLSWGHLPSTEAYAGLPVSVRHILPFGIAGVLFVAVIAAAIAAEYAAADDEPFDEEPDAWPDDEDDDDDEEYGDDDGALPVVAAPVEAVVLPPVFTPFVMPALPPPGPRFNEPVLSPEEEVDRLMAEEIRRLREELCAITHAADAANF